MKRLTVLLLTLLVVCMLLPSAAWAGKKSPEMKFDQALDRIFAKGYPQALEKYFVALGTNPDLGFRWAGTSAEKAASLRTYQELRAAGLKPQLEAVPVDVFEFTHAHVSAPGHEFMASTFGGMPPTDADGITADVIYVGSGNKADFDAAEAAYGPVKDKLVLVDLDYWMTMPGAEATARGAAGVISTYGEFGYFYYDPTDLGSHDGNYQFDWVPMVYISQANGDVMRAEVQAANAAGTSYEATMVCDIDVQMADDGGRGYNVVARLPGRDHSQATIISAHLDCHFRAGMDDTAAVVNLIAIAKAMRTSGYKPQYDVFFLATAGEEFGYTNCYYDWLIGAWWAATKSHPEWAGKARAFIGMELMGLAGAPLGRWVSEEIVDPLKDLAKANPDLVPYGTDFAAPVYCWNDQWPFAAEGIPGIRFGTSNALYSSLYHTTSETIDLVNWEYLANIGKFIFRTQRMFDRGLLPYDLPARAATLSASVDEQALIANGADDVLASDLATEVARFAVAANAFEAEKTSITNVAPANRELLDIVKIVTDEFTALDAWDNTVYPHQQVFRDLVKLNTALGKLEEPADPAGAAAVVGTISQMSNALEFSYEAFVADQARHAPDYYRITWGAQGQLAPYHDLYAEYEALLSGDPAGVAGAKASLTDVRDAQVELLDERLAQMIATLEKVNPRLEALTP